MKSIARAVSLAFCLLASARCDLAEAGYVVVMADTTPFFPLIYDFYEGFDGNRQFFRNLSADAGSVLVTGGARVNPPFRFYEAAENTTAAFTSEEMTAETLERVTLVITDRRQSFTTAEAELLSTLVRNGGTLFIGVDVTSPRGSGSGEVDLAINAANSLLSKMSIGMSVTKESLDSGDRVARGTQIRTHPLTRGVSEFGYGYTGRVNGGVPLFRTTGRVPFAAAVFVPEPATLALAGASLLAVAVLRRRK